MDNPETHTTLSQDKRNQINTASKILNMSKIGYYQNPGNQCHSFLAMKVIPETRRAH